MRTVVISLELLLLLFAFVFWPTIYRFDHTKINGREYLIRTNRITGSSDAPAAEMSEKRNAEQKALLKLVPESEILKITGWSQYPTKYQKGSFVISVHNGSRWHIEEMMIRIKTFLGDTLRWQEDYLASTNIFPYSISEFNFSAHSVRGFDSVQWGIMSAYGYAQDSIEMYPAMIVPPNYEFLRNPFDRYESVDILEGLEFPSNSDAKESSSDKP